MRTECTACQSSTAIHQATRRSANGTRCACGHNARNHKLTTFRGQCSNCDCTRHHYDEVKGK